MIRMAARGAAIIAALAAIMGTGQIQLSRPDKAGLFLTAQGPIAAAQSASPKAKGPYYGFFVATGAGMLRPGQTFFMGRPGCWDDSCSHYNPQISRTLIHTPIIETYHTGGGGLQGDWAFCRQLEAFMTTAVFRKRGMSCHVYSRDYPSRAAAEAALAEQIAKVRNSRGMREILVEEFTSFKPENFGRFRIMPFGSAPLAAGKGTAAVQTGAASSARAAAPRAAPVAGTVQPAAPPLSQPVTSAQAQAELAKSQQLNRAQAAFAAKQVADNAAAQAAFEQATRDRAATIARQTAAHEAAVAAVEAERLRREREHAAAMARWRADVAACQAGDLSRCAPAR